MTSPIYPGHEIMYDDPVGSVVELHAPGFYGTKAQRLAFVTTGLTVSKLWFETDTNVCYQWNGTSWQTIAASGGSVTSVTATAPIVSSGGSTPVISFSGTDINSSGKVLGINGTAMTLEGTTDRVFKPKLDSVTASAFSPVSGTAYFTYLGTTANAITPQYVRIYSFNGTVSSMEVGFFSSPNPPNASGQTLTKLVSGTVTYSSAVVNKNASAFATSIPAGTHLWAGFLATWSVQPMLNSAGDDFNSGQLLSLAGSGTFATTSTFVGSITALTIAPPIQGCLLIGTLD